MDNEKQRLSGTSLQEMLTLTEMFERDNGRLPNLAEVMLMREAVASVALDKDGEVGTYSLDTIEVMAEGAYTRHAPADLPDPPAGFFTDEEADQIDSAVLLSGTDPGAGNKRLYQVLYRITREKMRDAFARGEDSVSTGKSDDLA